MIESVSVLVGIGMILTTFLMFRVFYRLFRRLMYAFNTASDWRDLGDGYEGCIYDRRIDLSPADLLPMFYGDYDVYDPEDDMEVE